MSVLMLFTNSFPYGEGETYLETELPYLCESFSQVVICSLNVRKHELASRKREVPKNVRVIPVPFLPKITYLFMSPSCLVDRNFWHEVKLLFGHGNLNPSRLVRLAVFVTRSRHEARYIRRKMQRDFLNGDDRGILYSYRMDYQPYVALLLKDSFPRWPVIARGHRYDLYEERNKDGYIPFREYYAQELNLRVAISEHGKRYLERYGCQERVMLSRLGTCDLGLGPYDGRGKTLRVVSCSNIVPVKRVQLIAKALSKMNGVYIRWTHFGDGELMNSLCDWCSTNLGDNVIADLRGSIPNRYVLEEYTRTQYDVFVNVSADEGLPVSIMEAMSFGIPCVATNVGGTSEIVENRRNGFLIDATCDESEIAEALLCVVQMCEEDYLTMRYSARAKWSDGYDASTNYRLFVEQLCSLVSQTV